MQAVKEKLNDIIEIRKAKADAKAEEKAEKDLAKVRLEIAHEIRLAKEAEAEMQFHAAKAEKLLGKEIEKISESHEQYLSSNHLNSGGGTNNNYDDSLLTCQTPGSSSAMNMAMIDPINTIGISPEPNYTRRKYN
ncbi:late embryogenesis abundant protein 6-like [Impatiens glandulifera]|uniref:late embryogenesis abundant protein 6-like n=1 Tax=Impatiens glandulifera TaxID=253017 RepID=UPI001FB0FD54|nr:late embryogenesis abundant protein 6-like [Impatiens glandulifera]